MKKLLLAIAFLSLASIAKADTIWFNLGNLQVNVPFAAVSSTALWDFKSKQGLLGAETPLLVYKELQLTGGAITSLQGQGSPFVGLNVALVNPLENFAPLAAVHPGIFGGRDFNTNAYIVGLKVSTALW